MLGQDLFEGMGEGDRRGIVLPRRDRVGVDTDLVRELVAAPSESQSLLPKLGTAQWVAVHALNLEHGACQRRAQRE
jgi:hypothetical protein